MSTELVQQQEVNMTNVQEFEHIQRVAAALAKSTIVPREFQNNIANCMIAVEMASRLNIPAIMVCQNLYIVNGRPSWSSQFIIGAINNSRRFPEPLQFHIEGTGENLSCYCYVKDQEGKLLKGPTITYEMAKQEGWTSKNGSKWRTMPELMIQYRAAAFFGRLYCPDLLMGVYTDVEVREMEAEKEVIEVTDPFKEVQNGTGE